MNRLKLLSVCLCITMLFSGCFFNKEGTSSKDSESNSELSENSDSTNVTPTPSPTATAKPTAEPTPEPTAEPTPSPTPEPIIILYDGASAATLSFECGDEFDLSAATYSESISATFTCDNPDVLYVDEDGHCTALSAGTANVVATYGDSTEVCKVAVKAKPVPVITICFLGKPVSDFTMNASANETIQLSAVVDPDSAKDDIVWSVTDTSVATVDENGLVTAIKEGSAKVVCTSGEGSAECWVRVKGVKPTYYYADDSSTETNPQIVIVYQGFVTNDFTVSVDQAVDLDYKLYNLTDSGVIWTSEKQSIATVDANGVVVGVSAGSTTVTAKCGDYTATTIVRVN